MSCDVGKAAEGLENELWRRWSDELWMSGASFSNPSAALPMSQLILQPFRFFTYVIGTSPTSSGEPPRPLWWCLIYPWWFCNLQWLRPAGLYETCKLALELKRLKTPALGEFRWCSITSRGFLDELFLARGSSVHHMARHNDHHSASQLAGPGSIPGRVSFPSWGFSGVLLQLQDKCRENLSPIHSRISLAIKNPSLWAPMTCDIDTSWNLKYREFGNFHYKLLGFVEGSE